MNREDRILKELEEVDNMIAKALVKEISLEDLIEYIKSIQVKLHPLLQEILEDEHLNKLDNGK